MEKDIFFRTFDELLEHHAFNTVQKRWIEVLKNTSKHEAGSNLKNTLLNQDILIDWHIYIPEDFYLYRPPNLAPKDIFEIFLQIITKNFQIQLQSKHQQIQQINLSALSKKLQEIKWDLTDLKNILFHIKPYATISENQIVRINGVCNIHLLQFRFSVDLLQLIQECNFNSKHILRYFGVYDNNNSEDTPVNREWKKSHTEKFYLFCENLNQPEILKWYQKLSNRIQFDKFNIQDASDFFVEAFLVLALARNKSGNSHGDWRHLKKLFRQGRLYGIHLMPMKLIKNFKTNGKNSRIPSKLKIFAQKKRLFLINAGKYSNNFNEIQTPVSLFSSKDFEKVSTGKHKSILKEGMKIEKEAVKEAHPNSQAINDISPKRNIENNLQLLKKGLTGVIFDGAKKGLDFPKIYLKMGKAVNHTFKKLDVDLTDGKFNNIVSKVMHDSLQFSEQNSGLELMTGNYPELPFFTAAEILNKNPNQQKIEECSKNFLESAIPSKPSTFDA